MPELVEVENYLHQFQPLVSKYPLTVECPSDTPPKNFLSHADVKFIGKCYVSNLERKGKLIRVNLKNVQNETVTGCLYFHMGMTGRISTPERIPTLESLSNDHPYPPPHTHLILKANSHEISFSDPRRFGAVCLNNNGPLESQWNEIATDAMDENACFDGFLGRNKGIKALLLDQRAVISGVGNWIADEVLYQCKIHPDQTFLSDMEVNVLKEKLKEILEIGIKCLDDEEEFPKHWMFQSRWKKRTKENLTDHNGHIIKFVTSGGRTSAIVPIFQQMVPRKATSTDDMVTESKKKRKRKVDVVKQIERKTKKTVEQTTTIKEVSRRHSSRRVMKKK